MDTRVPEAAQGARQMGGQENSIGVRLSTRTAAADAA